MTLYPLKSDPVLLLARAHDYFPAAFRWRGRRFDVQHVEKCWTVKKTGAQRMFRVQCQAGSFVLSQTVGSDTWHVCRWPLSLWLATPPQRSPRFPLPRRQRRPARRARLMSSTSPKPAVAAQR